MHSRLLYLLFGLLAPSLPLHHFLSISSSPSHPLHLFLSISLSLSLSLFPLFYISLSSVLSLSFSIANKSLQMSSLAQL
jgi:hypothetical protein